jgi:hypothetical protein
MIGHPKRVEPVPPNHIVLYGMTRLGLGLGLPPPLLGCHPSILPAPSTSWLPPPRSPPLHCWWRRRGWWRDAEMGWGKKRVRAREGIVRAVACSRASEAIARVVVRAGNIRREIAQNAAPRYIFTARVKKTPLLEEYIVRAVKKSSYYSTALF